jgi:hypothetical protein
MPHLRSSETKILHSALEQLKLVHAGIKPQNVILAEERFSPFDGRITLKTDAESFQYLLEIKAHPRPETIRHLIVLKDTDKEAKNTPILVVADYLNPNLAAKLREEGINYLDTTGNLFLKRAPNLYMQVEGKKPSSPVAGLKTRLFQPSGLTLLFGLLTEPQSINYPYRRLAEEAGVALGTVGWVMRDLRNNHFLEPAGKDQLRLVNTKDLTEQWVQGYARTLRPRILVGEYGNLAPHLEDVVSSLTNYTAHKNEKWALTGGFAADELLRHYRGQKLAFYVSDWWSTAVLKELPIVPVAGGDITVLRAFSPRVVETPKSLTTEHPLAHPLLIYAELLYQGMDRDMETARMLYAEFLEGHLGNK